MEQIKYLINAGIPFLKPMIIDNLASAWIILPKSFFFILHQNLHFSFIEFINKYTGIPS